MFPCAYGRPRLAISIWSLGCSLSGWLVTELAEVQHPLFVDIEARPAGPRCAPLTRVRWLRRFLLALALRHRLLCISDAVLLNRRKLGVTLRWCETLFSLPESISGLTTNENYNRFISLLTAVSF